MTYAEKLKDPRWQKMRLEILERDKFKCRFCQDDKTELHVHHIFYKKGAMPWEYNSLELMTLCAPCHSKIEHVGEFFKTYAAQSSGSVRLLQRIMVAIAHQFEAQLNAYCQILEEVFISGFEHGKIAPPEE